MKIITVPLTVKDAEPIPPALLKNAHRYTYRIDVLQILIYLHMGVSRATYLLTDVSAMSNFFFQGLELIECDHSLSSIIPYRVD